MGDGLFFRRGSLNNCRGFATFARNTFNSARDDLCAAASILNLMPMTAQTYTEIPVRSRRIDFPIHPASRIDEKMTLSMMKTPYCVPRFRLFPAPFFSGRTQRYP